MKKIILNDMQEKAINNALAHDFTIVTGGAGTGKSTLINMLAQKLPNSEVVTPTGKASARLKDDSIESSTIHSMLRFIGDGKFLKNNLNGVSVIIDESSMVDSELLHEVVKRNPAKIVLIGDNAQLFPVGSGSPFHDAIKIRPDIVTELTFCYRNSEAIYKNALKIRNGERPAKVDQTKNEYWEVRETGDSNSTLAKIIKLVESGKIDFDKDVILCTRNNDVDNFNTAIGRVVYPKRGEKKFVVGDRIMCVKNFAKDDVWNGTCGTITGINNRGEFYVKKDLGGAEVFFTKDMIKETKLAYAMTVHKSQGSQYRKVIFCCFKADAYMMLSRSMIYTAVTRAQEGCLVMGENKSFFNSINETRKRNTIMKVLNNAN